MESSQRNIENLLTQVNSDIIDVTNTIGAIRSNQIGVIVAAISIFGVSIFFYLQEVIDFWLVSSQVFLFSIPLVFLLNTALTPKFPRKNSESNGSEISKKLQDIRIVYWIEITMNNFSSMLKPIALLSLANFVFIYFFDFWMLDTSIFENWTVLLTQDIVSPISDSFKGLILIESLIIIFVTWFWVSKERYILATSLAKLMNGKERASDENINAIHFGNRFLFSVAVIFVLCLILLFPVGGYLIYLSLSFIWSNLGHLPIVIVSLVVIILLYGIFLDYFSTESYRQYLFTKHYQLENAKKLLESAIESKNPEDLIAKAKSYLVVSDLHQYHRVSYLIFFPYYLVVPLVEIVNEENYEILARYYLEKNSIDY